MVIFTIPAKEKRQRLKEIRQSKKSGKVSGPGIMKESIITVALQSGNRLKVEPSGGYYIFICFLDAYQIWTLPGEIKYQQWKHLSVIIHFKIGCKTTDAYRQCFASVKHPQANGLVERANRSLGEGIKARLDEKSKDWIEELPHILWAHRTTIKSSNGETPFSLTYGTEAVIPTEIGMPTLRTAERDPATNNKALEINLDLIEERREQASPRIKKQKAQKDGKKNYNTKSATQVSSQVYMVTATMKKCIVMPETKASLDPK
ncbi:reverse transcriptase domain-containing protein [Tanacetum coccineum]|uniref:Reverse transcriptase domain-containing protein n=1 Tax=Tanacetum coccineum TaxID=301880 RepID=A0ABQ4XHH5_9ASTR